jgi:hypothetical protein
MGDIVNLRSKQRDSDFALAYRKAVALDAEAKRYLTARAITPKLAAAHGLRTAKDWHMGSAILVPLGTLHGFDKSTGAVRNLNWHEEQKFTNPYGEGNSLYFTAGHEWAAIATDAREPIAIIEGPFKAIAASPFVPALAISGVYSWRTKSGEGEETEPLPEFAMFTWDGRVVYLGPDSDAADPRKHVGLAVVQLGAFLQSRGADVRILQLAGGGDKLGVDDYIAKHGGKKFAELLKAAPSLDDPAFHRWGVPEHKFLFTDNSAAECFVLDHGSDVRYVHGLDAWFLWRGERWVRDTDNATELVTPREASATRGSKDQDQKARAAAFNGACAPENARSA